MSFNHILRGMLLTLPIMIGIIPLWSITPLILLIILTTFLINSRHLVMGAALAPYLEGQPFYRVALIYFFMCDET